MHRDERRRARPPDGNRPRDGVFVVIESRERFASAHHRMLTTRTAGAQDVSPMFARPMYAYTDYSHQCMLLRGA